jgi:hypothetical protein
MQPAGKEGLKNGAARPPKRCPLCGALLFYTEEKGRLVFFEVAGGNLPVKVKPEHALENLAADVILYCSACAWYGPVAELI